MIDRRQAQVVASWQSAFEDFFSSICEDFCQFSLPNKICEDLCCQDNNSVPTDDTNKAMSVTTPGGQNGVG